MADPGGLEALEQVVADCGGAATRDGDRLRGRLPLGAVGDAADRLAALGLELQLLAAADTRSESAGEFTLSYVFAPPGLSPMLTLLAGVPAAGAFPSLAARSFAASRFEREIQDLFGLRAVDHPDPRRLALHQFWPEDHHPLRGDAAPRPDVADAGQPFPFCRVEGDGVFEITVGPVHAGIIEPGHFRFSVDGETVIHLETRLGFVHKGIEKQFEALPFGETWRLAERVSGDTSAGHALAYCQALEALAGCAVPPRARYLRVALLELERLYNHVGDVGMIVNDTGFSFGHSHCFRLREELLRLNERLTGSRLLRGAVVPGGIDGPAADAALGEVAARAGAIAREFADVAALCLDNTMVLERLQGTGRLTSATAREMQVVGLVGRASGLDADARRDAPFAAYGELGVRVATQAAGDVWARTRVRIDEAAESARLLGAAAAGLPGGPARVALPPLRPGADAVGLAEGWRGPVLYWVRAGGDAAVSRVKLVDPSFRNWPALERAVLGNIVPDFPLCNKSFNLSYSGSDA